MRPSRLLRDCWSTHLPLLVLINAIPCCGKLREDHDSAHHGAKIAGKHRADIKNGLGLAAFQVLLRRRGACARVGDQFIDAQDGQWDAENHTEAREEPPRRSDEVEDAAHELRDGDRCWRPLAAHGHVCAWGSCWRGGRGARCVRGVIARCSCGRCGFVVWITKGARKFCNKGGIAPRSVLTGCDLRSADDAPFGHPAVHECKVCRSIGLSVAGDDPVEHVQYYTVYSSGGKARFLGFPEGFSLGSWAFLHSCGDHRASRWLDE